MILLGYILIGHPEWNHAEIKIFSVYSGREIDNNKERLYQLINEGRIPISLNNIIMIENKTKMRMREIIYNNSSDADLTIVGFRGELLKKQRSQLFKGYENIGNIMFVNSSSEKEIIHEEKTSI